MLLKELRLQTKQLPALLDFYEELLGLPVIKAGTNGISITAGRSQIIFNAANSIENPFYHLAFNIPSNKFEEAFQWIQDKVHLLWLNEYESYIADFINWHAKSFYFTDPAGNILEFIARLDLNDVVDEKFSSMHIRNISEIGLVLPLKSFNIDVNKLLNQYPLGYFDKQPPMPHFRAIGNDEGLFVIVPENRIWFSTRNTASKIFPIEILFIENDKLFGLKM